MNPFTKSLLQFALSRPESEIKEACLHCLHASKNGSRREAMLRYACSLSEGLKEEFSVDGRVEEHAVSPQDKLIRAVMAAAVECADWPTITRVLFAKVLPVRHRELITCSVN